MLQWMGGSRRKVTTSRKSTHKRQKQYFEQRRRQQHQQIAGLESYEGVNIWGQNHKEQRSLDILSLLNLRTNSQGCNPACGNRTEDTKVNASTLKHRAKDPPIILGNTVTPADSLEIKEARTLSDYHVENVSPKKILVSSPENDNNAFNRIDEKEDLLKTATQQQLSFFNLLGGDGPNGNGEGKPVREAHVAFSVEGLGKVEAETPVHSPQQPDRYNSCNCSSSLKAARRLNSLKNHNYVPDDLELEVDPMVQDINMSLHTSSLEFSTGIKDSCSKLKNNFFCVRDHMQLDGNSSQTRSSFSDRKIFHNTGTDNEDIWNTSSSLLDAKLFDESESDMSWKSLPFKLDIFSADFLKSGNDDMPDYTFEGPPLPKKRNAMKGIEGFNILESLPPEHQTSEDDCDFIVSNGTRKHRAGKNFDFGDVTGEPDWSCFVMGDGQDNLSLLSEQSCLFSAVRGEATYVSLSKSTARHRKRHQKALSGLESMCGAENNFAKGRHFKSSDGIWKGDNACISGKSTWKPTVAQSKLAHNLNCPFQEKIGPCKGWMFEEGYRSADMNLGFSSVCRTSEAKHPCTGSKPWTENILGLFSVTEPQTDANFSFDRSRHGSSNKYPLSDIFVSEEFAFYKPSSCMQSHDSPTFSKVEFKATKPDLSPDSPNFELESRPADSSHDGVSHRENLVPDLSSQLSVSKDEENKSKFQQANYKNVKAREEILVGKGGKAVDASDSVKNAPECKEAKAGTSEMSSSVNIPDKSEGSSDEKEYHGDAEVRLPCQNGNKEAENQGP